jgi:hypothetical protein
MRMDGTAQTRGASMGHLADASSAAPCDVPRNHYNDHEVQTMGRRAAALCLWQRRGLKARSGTGPEEPVARGEPRVDASRFDLGAGISQDGQRPP